MAALLTFFCMQLWGADLGVHGTTFEIAEDDLIERIHESADEDRCAERYLELKEHYKAQLIAPSSLGLPKAVNHQVHYFDPTIIVQEDIVDHRGEVIIAKGESYNPLEQMTYACPLLFFDGDDDRQLAWAEGYGDQAKWILVKGKPLALEERLERLVYFDQRGWLTDKLKIKSIPCCVVQMGNLLKVEEIPCS